MGDDGWSFSDGPGCVPDTVNGADYLWQIYAKADPRYTGRVTVPVLWDKKQNALVNNESARNRPHARRSARPARPTAIGTSARPRSAARSTPPSTPSTRP